MKYTVAKPLLVLILTLSASLSATAGEKNAEPRLSTTTFQNTTTQNHYPAGTSEKTEPGSKRTVQNHIHGLWVYDLFINLTTDIDYDGHYSSFSVSLDLESDFSPYTVYAVMYLSQNNGPWLEYAVTGNFTVSGTGSHDSIFVESSLDSGYANGYYDHYIEIYDAYDHSLLLSYGPYESHHSHNIPFESYQYDNFVSPVSVRLTLSGSGSLTLGALLFFVGLAGFQRYTKWSRQGQL